jgi:small subunit ribosomal protein S5
MNIIEIRRGSGSWECSTAVPNSLPFEVSGRTGSTRITIKPAPPGVGLVTNQVGKIMLKLAGIEDAWSFTKGQTQTIYNFASAMFNALKKTTTTKLLPGQGDFHNMVKGVKQE